MRILLVEDDEWLAQMLADSLVAQHYAVDVATDGEAGWNFAQSATYDLIVLDINLPKLDGICLCQRLRESHFKEPILLLTAKGESSDKVLGLDAGADDYVVKPCEVGELLARIRALLRRKHPFTTPVLEWGELRLDPSACEVTYQGQKVQLSAKEYSLLELFLRHPQRVLSSNAILEHLWGFDNLPGEETVRTHIKRLRRKCKSAGIEEIIETVYGLGYRLKPSVPTAVAVHRDKVDGERVDGATGQQSPLDLLPTDPGTADQARTVAIALWEQFKPTTLQRLTVLDQMVTRLQAGNLSEEGRQQAEHTAHKLAGSLGMFGLAEGTAIAREIEYGLQALAGQIPLQLSAPQFLQFQSLVRRLQQAVQGEPRPVQPAFSHPIVLATDPSSARPLLLVVDDDMTLTQRLQAEGIAYGIQVEVATQIGEARSKIAHQLPDVVLLDLAFPGASWGGLILLQELTRQFPQLPILVYTVNDGFSDRLQVARHGGQTLISKSTPLPQVWDLVRLALKRTLSTPIKVLAVDDDPLILQILQHTLKHPNFCLVTLDHPQDFWLTLAKVGPDLLILDVDMPDINGLELCQVIRSDRAWDGLPILFLTGCRDADTIQRLYSLGADDYIAKPCSGVDVMTRIYNRLQRNHRLQTLTKPEHQPL